MDFKPNLHKTDWRYSVKNFLIGFAKKFYPNLIYKQIKFQLFLQILQFLDIDVYWNIVSENEMIFYVWHFFFENSYRPNQLP